MAKKTKSPKKPPKQSGTELAASPSPYRESHHVSVRKIDNGYVTSHSGYKGDKHYERESYHPKKPTIKLTGTTAQMEKKIGNSKV
jgi:hypothetical protein